MLVPLFLIAAPAGASDAKPEVEKCEREMGSLAVAEPQDHMLASLSRYSLGSPSVMLRMLAQESGCFAVVERGVALQNLQQERALASSGQLQQGSNIGGGQMQAADFVMTPSVQFSGDSGGVGGAVGGLLGKIPGAGFLSGVAGGVKFREAETTLLVADVRSGIQVASAEGKASKMNFSLGGWGWGGLGWASGGGYTKTPEGKLIAASLLNNFNAVVQQIRSKPQLIRQSSASSQQNAANSLPATGGLAANAQPVAAPGTPRLAPLPPLPNQRPAADALPAALVGAYTGYYQGSDNGVFSVVVAPDGRISGIGQTAAQVGFNVTGMASAGGNVVMNSQGQAGAATFSGVIDGRSGALVGTWQIATGGRVEAQGSFSGKKQ
jgi:curli biogenesis system outer membrane secretion channel CsgG